MGVERALKSHVFDHVSLFSLANLRARAQTRFQRTFHPIFDEDRKSYIVAATIACRIDYIGMSPQAIWFWASVDYLYRTLYGPPI
jgi:hypothetical protein